MEILGDTAAMNNQQKLFIANHTLTPFLGPMGLFKKIWQFSGQAVFYRTYPLLYHKIGNMVICWPGNVYSLGSPGNQDYPKIIHF